MAIRVQERDVMKRYETAIRGAVWRACSGPNGWEIEASNPVLIGPYASQTVIQLRNPEKGIDRGGYVFWTRHFSDGFRCFGVNSFTVWQGPMSASKSCLVKKRDKAGNVVVEDGEPVMVWGAVGITNEEFAERFQSTRAFLGMLVDNLEAFFGDPIETPLRSEPVYAGAKPKPYNGVLPKLVQGLLFERRGLREVPLYDYPHDPQARLT